jgi:hypothetical protein
MLPLDASAVLVAAGGGGASTVGVGRSESELQAESNNAAQAMLANFEVMGSLKPTGVTM